MFQGYILAYSFLSLWIMYLGGLVLHFKNSLFAILALLLGLCALIVQADVYRCSTDNGSVTLSNVEKGPACKKMVLPPPEARKPTPAKADNAGKLAPMTDKAPLDKSKANYDTAAAERKRIIQEEMDLEKVRLNAVQARIKELTAAPNKTPDQLKDLVALQQKETQHTSNLQILQKELNK